MCYGVKYRETDIFWGGEQFRERTDFKQGLNRLPEPEGGLKVSSIASVDSSRISGMKFAIPLVSSLRITVAWKVSSVACCSWYDPVVGSDIEINCVRRTDLLHVESVQSTYFVYLNWLVELIVTLNSLISKR